GRIRRNPDWTRAYADPPGWDSDHEYVGESGTEHWSGAVCRRLGPRSIVDVYYCPTDWGCAGGGRLGRDPRRQSADHNPRSRGSTGQRAKRKRSSGSEEDCLDRESTLEMKCTGRGAATHFAPALVMG